MSRAVPHKGSVGSVSGSAVFWLTGLSGAGKSTLAFGAQQALLAAGFQVSVLDGDILRAGLNRDLGFSDEDRVENMRRTAEVAKILADTGVIVIVSLISPLHSGRELAREIIGSRFHEIYLAADLSVCERRDPKGLYRRARSGALSAFTGISSPYEVPVAPDCVIDTAGQPVSASVRHFLSYIRSQIMPADIRRFASM
jgi:adenylyl-sulfate kinase